MKTKQYWVAAALAVLSIPLIAAAQAPGDGMGGWHGKRGGGHHGGHGFSSNPTIAADRTALDEAFTQLRTDVKAGNTSAVAGDQAAITTAYNKLLADHSALHTALQSNAAVQSAKALVKADRTAVAGDRVQLRSDTIAGNATAVTADQAALQADMAKLRTDRKALADAVAAVTI